MPGDRTDAARLRSAIVRTERSVAALLASAEVAFQEHGWHGARIDDIARRAGVTPKTAYNHFPGGKQELIGVVYAPLLGPLRESVRAAVASDTEPVEAVRRHVIALFELAGQHRALTQAMLSAAFEQMIKVGEPDDPRDVRMIVPIVEPLMHLVAYGQRLGVFRSQPAAEEIGIYQGNALLVQFLARPGLSAEHMALMTLSQLLPALMSNGVAERHGHRIRP